MNRVLLSSLIAATAPLAACASAPRPIPSDTKVTVDWTDVAKFADTRSNMCHGPVKPAEWLARLARFTQSRAVGRLQEGQTLKVTITDIQRAGQCEPWRGPRMDDVRILKDIYPPSLSLHYRLTDANGALVSEGDYKKTDLGYLQGGNLLDSHDPLRFEKRMIDDWLRKNLSAH